VIFCVDVGVADVAVHDHDHVHDYVHDRARSR
jgi:hypothetical protein